MPSRNNRKDLWRKQVTPEDINAQMADSLSEGLGISVTEVGADYLSATMPVDHRTRQPFGYLHGGASVALAETLGSVAGYLTLADESAAVVGVEINANHVRPVRSGYVTGTARPLHLGATTQVWETRIVDEGGDLVCVSRMTLAVVKNPRYGGQAP